MLARHANAGELIAHDCALHGNPSHSGIDDLEREYPPALLARCGPVSAFAGNHEAIFAAQPVWLTRVVKASDAQKASWYQGDTGARARKIATDTGLAALMQKRGYSAAQVNACLDSEVAQAEVTGMTNIGLSGDHVRGTPTFFVNGRDAETTTWPVLKTKLDAALKGS